jgi:hypothetical protein
MTKVTVYISDPESVVTNGMMKEYCHNVRVLAPDEAHPLSWVPVGEVEYDEANFLEECRALALERLEKASKNLRAEFVKDLDQVETRKQNLLAIAHMVEELIEDE